MPKFEVVSLAQVQSRVPVKLLPLEAVCFIHLSLYLGFFLFQGIQEFPLLLNGLIPLVCIPV